MQQSDARHSSRQEGSVPKLLRSRTRTRRRRRKRSWGAPWASSLPFFLTCGTLWTSPVLVSLALLFQRLYGRPARHRYLMACSH